MGQVLPERVRAERQDVQLAVLLRAEGAAFCAGFGLDWSTVGQAREDREAEEGKRRVWDSVGDLRMMGRFVDTYLKLWYAKKPTIADTRRKPSAHAMMRSASARSASASRSRWRR